MSAMAAGGDQHRAAQHPGPTTAVLIAAMSLCVLLRPPRSLVSAVKTALGDQGRLIWIALLVCAPKPHLDAKQKLVSYIHTCGC